MRCSIAKRDKNHRCVDKVKEVIIYDANADHRWGKTWNYCRQGYLVDTANGLTVIGYINDTTPIEAQYEKFRARNLKLKQRQKTA